MLVSLTTTSSSPSRSASYWIKLDGQAFFVMLLIAIEFPDYKSLSRCNQGRTIVECRPFEERDTHHLSRLVPADGSRDIEDALCDGCELRSQPGPQEKRECQHQRASSKIKPRTRADRRSGLIQRPLIRHRSSAMAALFLPRIAKAALSAACAPIA